MTRVLFTCWPFEGHYFPQLSMAHALRRRGAEVAFYTDASVRGTIEGEGFTVFPFRRVAPAWMKVHGREGTAGRRERVRLMREAGDWLVGSIPDQVRDVLDVVAEWQPDVIACDASMWGPQVVLADLIDTPVALASPLTGPLVAGPESPVPLNLPPRSLRGRAMRVADRFVVDLFARPMRRRIDEARAQFGLGPMGRSVQAQAASLPLYQVLNVPELDHRRSDLPPSIHYVGACLWHPPEPPGTTDWLDAIPDDRPWVHVTEGTSRFEDPFVLRAAAEGLAYGPWEAILTTGRGIAPERVGIVDPAANIHVTAWLSHDVLLPRCDVVVTTGGMATIMASLRSGVPLVVVPTGWDKPVNARRVEATGVGVRLSPRRCSPSTLRAAVQHVLDDPGYRARAQQGAELLAAAPGPDGAAELLEGLAHRTPVTAAAGGAS